MEFNAVRPCSAEQIRANVRNAIGLGLQSVVPQPERAETLHIYASGPSLATEEMQWPCMALNGSLAHFERISASPTYWAACDPQGIVAAFLDAGVEPEAAYLVASRCDPTVFDRLAARFDKIRLWHLADEGAEELDDTILIPDAPSVTLSALFMAHLLGYRAVVVHAWDGCYRDNISHAYGGDDGKQRIPVDVCGKSFIVNPTWLVEQEDAARVLCMLWRVDIKIAGDGFFATSLAPVIGELQKMREMDIAA